MSIEETKEWRRGSEMLTPAGTVCIEDPSAGDVGYVFPEYVEQIIAAHNRASTLDATLTRAQTAEAALAQANQAATNTKAALAEAMAALETIRAATGIALARIDQHPTQEVDDHE